MNSPEDTTIFTTNTSVSNSANTNSNNENAASEAARKDLTHYVNIINQLLITTSSVHTDGDTRLQFAIEHLCEGLEFYPDAYELKFLAHKISIKEGDMSQAIESFDELRRLFPNHEPLKKYLVQITQSVRHQSMDDNFMFFLKLPARTQKDILRHSAEYHEMAREHLDACKLYVLLLKAYPETVAFYGSHAAQLAIQCEDQNQPLPVSNSYRKILVEDILPGILHQKIIVYDNNLPPEIPTYQPNTSSSTSQLSSSQSCLHVTYSQLKSWLERVQGFYIANKDWKKLFEVSLGVMDSCGYLRFESSPRITMVEEPHKLPSKLFSLLNQRQTPLVNQSLVTHDTAPHPFAVSIGIACFVLCCHEFYEYVSGLKSKRTCLIPVFPIQQSTITTLPSSPLLTSTSPVISQIVSSFYDPHHDQYETRVGKKRKLEKNKSNNVMDVENLLTDNDDQQEQSSISIEISGQELNIEQFNLWKESFISSEVIIHDAISHIERALTCWQLLEEMVQRGGNDPKTLDQDLENHIQSWNLPLDVSNAIMLTCGDLALSRGSWDKAYTFCQKICTRIEGAWDAHRKKVSKREQSPSLSSPTTTYLQQSLQEESLDPNDFSVKAQSPLLLTFRVIYSISMIYLLIGWWREARKELLMILATIPFTPVTHEHFKKDDWCMNETIDYSDGYSKQFKLMEVTQEGLVVRAIKELIACYEKELSYHQIDIDNILGHMIVLMQYGWPYWRNRLFQRVILPKIKEHGGLNYPDMLRFVYNNEILREICELYRTSPDLNFSLLKQNLTTTDQSLNSDTTKASIQALEDKISQSTLRNNGEKLVEFCKERLIHLQNSSGDNLYSDGLKNDKAKGKGIPSITDNGYTCDNSDVIITGQENAQETDMQSPQSNITNTQETQTIQKSWKMNVSSIVAVDSYT